MKRKIKIGDIVRHKGTSSNKVIVTSIAGNGIGTFTGVWIDHHSDNSYIGTKSNRFRYEYFELDIEPFEHRFKIGDSVTLMSVPHLRFIVTDGSEDPHIFEAVCIQDSAKTHYKKGVIYNNLDTNSFKIQ